MAYEIDEEDRSILDSLKQQQSVDELEQSHGATGIDPLTKNSIQMRQDRHTQNLWAAGATPLLVGLLAGNTGDAMEIGSKALMQEQERAYKEEQTLLGYLAKRKAASASNTNDKGKFQQLIYEGQDGIPKIGVFDTSTGQAKDLVMNGDRVLENKGYKATITKDAEGNLIKIPSASGAMPVENRDAGVRNPAVTPMFKKRVDQVVDKYSTLSKTDSGAIDELQIALSNFGQGEFQSKIAISSLIKKVEGRLSDQDRQFYNAPLSMLSRLMAKLETEKGDKIPPRLMKEVASTLNNTEKMMRDMYAKKLSKIVDSESVGRLEDEKIYLQNRLKMFTKSPPKYTKEFKSILSTGSAPLEKKSQREKDLILNEALKEAKRRGLNGR